MNKLAKTISIVAAMAALLAACAPRAAVKNSSQSKNSAEDTAISTAPVVAVADTEASLRGKEFSAVEGIAPVYFDYDSSQLKQSSLDVLKVNADYLKAHPDNDVLVTGNCDARGTIEYNLALGQKRAKTVREYYIRLGIAGGNIATISYGKEKPVCTAEEDSCHAKNRRAETLVRAHTVADGNSPSQ